MKRLTAFVLGMALLPLLVILLAIVSSVAHAQVTDKPVTTWPTSWTGTVYDARLLDKGIESGCVAGWKKAADPYARWARQIALLNLPELNETPAQLLTSAATQGDIATLIRLRTVDVQTTAPGFAPKWHPVAQPCVAKLVPPPAPWIVAAAVDGPAYCLNADGTRGSVCARAAAMITGVDVVPSVNWCRCDVLRSKEPAGGATYCLPAMSTEQRLDRQRLVTRCKKNSAAL